MSSVSSEVLPSLMFDGEKEEEEEDEEEEEEDEEGKGDVGDVMALLS